MRGRVLEVMPDGSVVARPDHRSGPLELVHVQPLADGVDRILVLKEAPKVRRVGKHARDVKWTKTRLWVCWVTLDASGCYVVTSAFSFPVRGSSPEAQELLATLVS